jgi:hypothetical protein
MPTSNKSLDAFGRAQQPLAFVCINGVLDVLLMRQQLQVVKSIVRTDKVFVVDFKSIRNWPVKRFPDYAMNAAFGVLASTTKVYDQVVRAIWSWFNQPITSFTYPRFAQFDGVCGRDADGKERGYFFQRGASGKHFFGLRHFGCVNRFAPRNPAQIAVIADFIQIFKAKNWFPRFHAQSPFNMNGSVA